ncbi:ATP-binding protein [Streptomyces sp. NBC_01296]|uniref:ATP-binding protein n=1 Tax=Streptomyces sp. NBC_01296 TaxID=2903816 RepID=UPI002E0D6386|nr:ATP-binding protein [Streptomyces sp. NBC_01296]
MNPSSPQLDAAPGVFCLLLSSTRRGARLGRVLAVTELRRWDLPPSITERAEQIVAELTSNAVLHGRVQGRDFRLGLSLSPAPRTLRIEVTDACRDRMPVLPQHSEGESGRGLLLVAALADRWGVVPYPPSGKTVWAEAEIPSAHAAPSGQSAEERL